MNGGRREEMTRLGFYGLAPFVLAAVALWLSPWLLPQHIALDFHQLALVYGAVIIAYLAGAGAGEKLAQTEDRGASFLRGQLITLGGFLAALPNGVFFMSLGAVWRHAIILGLLVYLLMRDMNAVDAGRLPRWYGALRLRLTFWAGLAIMLVASRLLLWGFY